MLNKNKTTKNEEGLEKPRDLEQENKELYSRLTNKNEDYFFQLNNRLEELSYDPGKKLIVMNKMLQETIEAQEESITARRMYGTVTERANQILGLTSEDFQEKQEASPRKHLYLDGALLFGGMFSAVNGFSAWRSPEITMGLLQFLMNFLLGGLVVLALIEYRPAPGQTEGMFRYTLVTVAVMLSWIFVMTMIQTVPPSMINPTLPPLPVIGVGAMAILVRFYVKNKLNIRGTLF